jgi:hypothetical protein
VPLSGPLGAPSRRRGAFGKSFQDQQIAPVEGCADASRSSVAPGRAKSATLISRDVHYPRSQSVPRISPVAKGVEG